MTRGHLTVGFHRLGIVLALPLLAVGLGVGIAALGGQLPDPTAALTFAAAVLVGAPVVYGACRALAWIATGFMAE